MASVEQPFKPALIVVDFQEDFCPPAGSLAVPHGRSIAPTVNTLLRLPFHLKIATRDWHPPSHVSFAHNHHPRKDPFTGKATIAHPSEPDRSYEITLWPEHCVQHSAGACLVPELDVARLHHVFDKGKDPHVEMYSAFFDPFRMVDTGLAPLLKSSGITHVYIVGLAADYCVKETAEHALEEGFRTFIVEEGTMPIDSQAWIKARQALDRGIRIVSADGAEVQAVQSRKASDSS